jgi:hypothetical protein
LGLPVRCARDNVRDPVPIAIGYGFPPSLPILSTPLDLRSVPGCGKNVAEVGKVGRAGRVGGVGGGREGPIGYGYWERRWNGERTKMFSDLCSGFSQKMQFSFREDAMNLIISSDLAIDFGFNSHFVID